MPKESYKLVFLTVVIATCLLKSERWFDYKAVLNSKLAHAKVVIFPSRENVVTSCENVVTSRENVVTCENVVIFPSHENVGAQKCNTCESDSY